ncbi:MAG: hypothetical protein FWC55_02115 [Firmicutes bacterium]|nr:hypothetical protein [Bacillota bacterium]
MNNEEKILHAVETLVIMQTTTQAQISELKTDVTGLKSDVTGLKDRVESIHYNLARLELENSREHGAIFDKLDVLESKTNQNTEAILRIEERLDMAEISIRAYNSK